MQVSGNGKAIAMFGEMNYIRKGGTMPRECARKSVKLVMQSVLFKVKNERSKNSISGEHGCCISGIDNTTR